MIVPQYDTCKIIVFVWGKIESYCSAITEPWKIVRASAQRSVLVSILRRSGSMIHANRLLLLEIRTLITSVTKIILNDI